MKPNNLDPQNSIQNLTRFGRYAVNAYFKRRFVGAIISGEFAKGKTTSSLHMGREILQHMYNIDRKTAFKLLLKEHLLFTMDDVFETYKVLKDIEFWESLSAKEVLEWKFKLRKPVLIWDDAGVHGSTFKHWLDMSDAAQLQSDFDTIRDITSCFIMTVPENEELLRFLRSYRGNYQVEILHAGQGEYSRKLQFKKIRKDKLGRRRLSVEWTSQPFSIYVEKEIYGEYDRMRTIAKLRNTKRQEEKRKLKEARAKYYEQKFKIQQLELLEKAKKLGVTLEELSNPGKVPES